MNFASNYEEPGSSTYCQTNWNHRGGSCVDRHGALPVWRGEEQSQLTQKKSPLKLLLLHVQKQQETSEFVASQYNKENADVKKVQSN